MIQFPGRLVLLRREPISPREFVSRRILRMLLLPVLLFPLTGCLVRTRNILITTPPDVVLSESPGQLVQHMNEHYDALQTLTATVNISATVEHADTGEAKDYTSVRGFIVIRKPDMLHVRGLLPFVSTPAFDMVSDGKEFTVYIPPLSKAISGGMTVTTASANAFENLRPGMFLDSLLLQRIGKDDLWSVTSDTRILDTNSKSHHVIEEPDYNLTTYRKSPDSNQLMPQHVVHISRRTMLPFQLDVYDDKGEIETQAIYDNYAKYGTLTFPSRITIRRPQQHMMVTLDIVKLDYNQQLEDDQFKLEIPDGTSIQHLK